MPYFKRHTWMVWTWEERGWMDWPCGLLFSLFKKSKPMKGWRPFVCISFVYLLFACVEPDLFCFVFKTYIYCIWIWFVLECFTIILILNPVYKPLIGLLFAFVISCRHWQRFKGPASWWNVFPFMYNNSNKNTKCFSVSLNNLWLPWLSIPCGFHLFSVKTKLFIFLMSLVFFSFFHLLKCYLSRWK